MGRAALELFDEAQAETIDSLEAGARLSGQIRFALQVPDLHAAMATATAAASRHGVLSAELELAENRVAQLLAHGATLFHLPVMTPWGDYNARLQDPEGMQVTLFGVSEKNE